MRYFTPICVCFAMLLCGSVRAADEKKDEKKIYVTGTWKWTLQIQGGDELALSAKLKQDGEKVTGTYYGRNNTESEIKEGKLKGNQLSFKVVRDINGAQITLTFNGKVDGDTVTGTMEFKNEDQSNSMEWKAKREKEAPKK